MMRRVSSRQRLVSWDAFDANVIFDSTSVVDGYYCDNDSSADEVVIGDEGLGGAIVVSSSILDYVTALEVPITPTSSFHGTRTKVLGRCDDVEALEDGGIDTNNSPNKHQNVVTCSPKRSDIDHHIPLNTDTSGIIGVVGRKRDRSAFRGSPSRGKNASVNNNPTSETGHKVISEIPTIIPSLSWELAGSTMSQVSSMSSPSSFNSLDSLSSSIGSPSQHHGHHYEVPARCTFDDLMDDAHMAVISFLDLSSIRNIMAVNHHYRQLMLSADAKCSLWMKHCQERWHLPPTATADDGMAVDTGNTSTATKITFVENYNLPMAATLGGTLQPPVHPMSDKHVNLPLLLSMTPKDLPTAVDQELAHGRASARGRRLIRGRLHHHHHQHHEIEELGDAMAVAIAAAGQLSSSDNSEILFYNDETTGLPLVRYNGAVGSGDRCIRSDHALPRPSDSHKKEKATNTRAGRRCGSWGGNLVGSASWLGEHYFDRQQNQQHHRSGSGSSNPFFNLLYRGANKVVGRVGGGGGESSSNVSASPAKRESQLKPFVIPFVDNHHKDAINVTPRLVSYYEVSILEKPKENNSDDEIDDDDFRLGNPGEPILTTPSRSNDCVAVGLATESFHVHSRMPGWDRQSFGYHGDDGGIFHSSGGMVKRYGPTFAAGDTVGCGIDYVEQGIFYTLNGQFLGYAWTGIDEEFLKNDLYPVVGLDTSCPLYLNFGTGTDEPFQFDLSSFLMKHENIISPLYQFTPSLSSLQKDGTFVDGDHVTAAPATSPSHGSRSRSSNNSNHGSNRGLFLRRLKSSGAVVPPSSNNSSNGPSSSLSQSRRSNSSGGHRRYFGGGRGMNNNNSNRRVSSNTAV